MIKNINDPNLTVRRPEESIKISDLFSTSNAQMSIVKIECSGNHSIGINSISDRIYYVVDGDGEVYIGDKWYPATTGDCVYISKGTACSLRGNLSGLVIDSPPFHPDNETIVTE